MPEILLLQSNFKKSCLYIHTTTPTRVKCTLLNPFRFGAHGAKMRVASHGFFSRTSPPFPVSKMVNGFILIGISHLAQRTWYSLWDTGCSFPDCRDRLSRENTGGNSVPFKEGKQVQWASAKGTNIHILLNAGTFKSQAEEKKSRILKEIIS